MFPTFIVHLGGVTGVPDDGEGGSFFFLRRLGSGLMIFPMPVLHF
jgi:hypothetical protein